MPSTNIKTNSILLALVFLVCVHAQDTNDNQTQTPTNETKYVLFWSDMMGHKNFYFRKTGFELFKSCKVNNCYATNNRTLLPLEEFDALLFYSPTKYQHRKHPLPPKDQRSKKQRYVYANSETPIRFFKKDQVRFVVNDYFNWTMSYRLDADLIRSHGYVYKEENPDYTYPNVSTKNKFAAIFVSNCKTPGKRELLIKELQKHISVDVYGKCGTLSCPASDAQNVCFDKIVKTHKFYLSFENSHCKDYVTEKLYYALNKNIVPVVYGGANYTERAPPSSYINVEDFDSVKDLVDFLKKVADSETEYLKYFEWKRHYKINLNSTPVVCQMCEKLHDANEPEKIYKDIKKWWFDPEYSGCRQPQDLPKIIKDLM